MYSFAYVPSGHGCVHVCSMMMKMFRIHFGSSRSIDQLHSCTVPQCTYMAVALPGHEEAQRKLAEWMDEQLGMDTTNPAGAKYQELFWFSRGIALDQQMKEDAEEAKKKREKAKQEKAKQKAKRDQKEFEKLRLASAKERRKKRRKERREAFIAAVLCLDSSSGSELEVAQ